MTIINEPRPIPKGATAMVRCQDDVDLGGRQDFALRALMRTGMSEQTALEQIARLSAGDVWSG